MKRKSPQAGNKRKCIKHTDFMQILKTARTGITKRKPKKQAAMNKKQNMHFHVNLKKRIRAHKDYTQDIV